MIEIIQSHRRAKRRRDPPFDSKRDFKNDPSRSKVLGLLESYSNNILLIFTDATYKHKDGKSSFGYLMTLNNFFVCTCGHCGPKLPSSKEAKVSVILLR